MEVLEVTMHRPGVYLTEARAPGILALVGVPLVQVMYLTQQVWQMQPQPQ